MRSSSSPAAPTPSPSSLWIGSSLVLAVILWGGNNVGLKFLARDWPPAWTASIRFLIGGGLLLGILRWSSWLGRLQPVAPERNLALWWRGGVLLAFFMLVCNLTFQHLPASHFALHMAASPVWALLFEGGFTRTWRTLRQVAAIALALAGVGVLLAPALRQHSSSLLGESLGLACGLGWTIYSRQARHLSQFAPAVEITARSMWRAGLILLPFGIIEIARHPIAVDTRSTLSLLYCSVFGAAAAYGLWNHALTLWPGSRVFLFSNLIPVTTMTGAYLILGEPLTSTFAGAMLLILAGVLLGAVDFGALVGRWWAPED